MQSEFVPVVEEATEECKRYFKDSFCTAYLHGSIALNDAVPYVSDMDYYLVVSKNVDSKDKEYIAGLENTLQGKYDVVNGVHINVHSIDELKEDSFARFILRYNSKVYSGEDIVKSLEESGCGRILPNADTAKGRLDFARQCFSDALNGRQPANTGDIPENTFFAARKYARYFVIIEGAYFLMTVNSFSSFEKEKVLNELRKITKGFEDILGITERVLYDPIKTGISHNEYLTMIKPLVEYMFEKIQNERGGNTI
ncbi:MAG: hypothetical protein HDT44_09395 [Ruminococcaceae bacterium]|nr:hypothetical protein [Oscillospiraceae bacterium]